MGKGSWWGPNRWSVPSSEHQSDLELDVGAIGDLLAVAGSARGASHRYEATERQDSFALRVSRPESCYLIATVADGVSSARYSGPAAEQAAWRAAKAFADRIEHTVPNGGPVAHREIEQLALEVLNSTKRDLLGEVASYPNGDASQYVTTLSWLIVPCHMEGSAEAYVGGVGDSPGWRLRQGVWTAFRAAGDDDRMSSATHALPVSDPSSSAWSHCVQIQHGDVLVLSSDGVGNAIGAGDTDVAQQLAEWWAEPVEPLAFLSQIQFDKKSFDDDRTAVAVWLPVLSTA